MIQPSVYSNFLPNQCPQRLVIKSAATIRNASDMS